jgi:hypothetical protein
MRRREMRAIPAIPLAILFLELAGASLHSLQAAPATHADPGATVRRNSPFACNRATLTPEARTRHFDVLGPKLRTLRQGVRELPNGYEFEFPSDTATYLLLTEWAGGERVCCPFFDIDVQSTREDGPLLLRLTGREGVKKFIEDDGAPWLKQ